MATDLTELMNRKGGEFKPPPTMPPGPYRFETRGGAFDKSKDKNTPFFSVACQYLEALEGVDQDALQGIEVNKRSSKLDFYLTEDATYRLINFAKDCGIENADNKTIKEICGEISRIKFQFVGYVTHSPNKNAKGPDDPKFYANITKTAKV